VDLAAAAEYFGVETLKAYCVKLIADKVNIEDVWTVLNKALDANNLELIAESCKEVRLIL
jgi:hypothetical protein